MIDQGKYKTEEEQKTPFACLLYFECEYFRKFLIAPHFDVILVIAIQ